MRAALLGLATFLLFALASAEARAGSASQGAPNAPAVANPHGDMKTECEVCHTAKSWKKMRKPMLFDHGSTGFALAGRHASADCVRCHRSLEFARVATSCGDCHRDVHEGRSGVRCQDCHSPSGWTNRSEAVAQHSRTGFRLRGMHSLVECARCHVGSGEANRAPLSRACYPCHATNYATAQSPNHISAGYSTECESCHDPGQARWGGAGFNHALTGFALTGAHTTTPCAGCHVGGRYTGTPRDCYSCHQADFVAATDPNHATLGFPTACAACHSTAAWTGASFDHGTTRFALTGAHTTTPCASCHVNGQYAGTPTDCYSCHQANYAATTNPTHTTAGYPTTCAGCHTTTAWSPASFDHDGLYFRIYSGRHAGTWASCSTCHANAASFAEFTCLSCHAHDQSSMDSAHQGRSGYVYDSNACYSCHRSA